MSRIKINFCNDVVLHPEMESHCRDFSLSGQILSPALSLNRVENPKSESHKSL